jgi:hypothetical protein
MSVFGSAFGAVGAPNNAHSRAEEDVAAAAAAASASNARARSANFYAHAAAANSGAGAALRRSNVPACYIGDIDPATLIGPSYVPMIPEEECLFRNYLISLNRAFLGRQKAISYVTIGTTRKAEFNINVIPNIGDAFIRFYNNYLLILRLIHGAFGADNRIYDLLRRMAYVDPDLLTDAAFPFFRIAPILSAATIKHRDLGNGPGGLSGPASKRFLKLVGEYILKAESRPFITIPAEIESFFSFIGSRSNISNSELAAEVRSLINAVKGGRRRRTHHKKRRTHKRRHTRVRK